jgi:pSer/pThr/pTyr-binding forkhead associated (FHA) protein
VGFVSDDINVPKAVFVPNAAAGALGAEYGDEWDGETTVLDMMDDGDETTILEAAASMPSAYLVREDTGERIDIIGGRFVLGRSRESANYCVDGRSVISRSHAAVVFEEGRYFVVDLNSSNKTFLDDIELVPGQGAELFSGSRIRIADMDFTFYIA